MAEFTITWVGDKVHDFKDRRTYSVSVRDGAGNESRKVKLELPQSDPAPTVGAVIEGALNPHPRFDDAKLLVPGGSAAAPSSGAAVSNDRSRSIERQTSAKAATGLVSSMVSAGRLETDEQVQAALAKFTEMIFAVIQEAAEKPAAAPAPVDSKEDPDADIPF
jgi:hypothetical protein